jgi:hypothetical protein
MREAASPRMNCGLSHLAVAGLRERGQAVLHSGSPAVQLRVVRRRVHNRASLIVVGWHPPYVRRTGYRTMVLSRPAVRPGRSPAAVNSNSSSTVCCPPVVTTCFTLPILGTKS